MPVQTDARFPLSAVMECSRSKRGPWRLPVWRLIGFVAGQAMTGDTPQRLPVHTSEGQTQWLWTGLSVALFRDSAESYWYNLVGRRPSLFLVCREEAEGGLAPFTVTANYDEAGAHMEADDLVFSAPIPPELHLQLEAFVMQYYQPQRPEKRKRVNWTEKADDGWKPSPRLARP
ncbi:MAG: DUF3305 domain-containing protein [Gammaproteobacteria bacterium]